MDTIRIDQLELDCIVGLRPDERHREQRVRVDLAFQVDLKQAGRSGRIAQTCDYDAVADEVMILLNFRRYRLMEMAAEELAATLLGTHPIIEQISVRLEKPGALEGRARAASVEITRQRTDFRTHELRHDFGTVLVLLDTREAELSLLSLSPGALYRPEPGQRDLHFVVFGQIALDDKVLAPFEAALHPGATYQAGGSDPCVLFRCRMRRTPR